MSGKIKISDIASQSGVSLSTVSLVLNNKPGVSEETRRRVLEVADQLKYPVKPAIGGITKNRLTTIGMVVKIDPDITPQVNPFYSEVIVGIEDACRRKGINLLFATLPVDDNNCPLEVPQLLYNKIVDGVLMVGTFIGESLMPGSGTYTPPIVLVDGYSDVESYDKVISDNFRAAYQAVEYLIKKGHRHIGLMGSDVECYPSFKDRRNGYMRAMKENELPDTYVANFNINKSKGYQETMNLLKEYPHLTALFCVNDDIGSVAIRAAHFMGKRVPGDLSIIGYDDTYLAANTHPALTTMHVDTVALGRAAVHLLTMRMEHTESAPMTLTIHSWLVERESAGLAP